jgi:hypothetical protein
MDKNETYEFIGQLADGLAKHELQLKLSLLRVILKDRGKEVGEGKGMGSMVRGAYNYWNKKDPEIAKAIANTYTNRFGNLAWDVE